MPKVQQACVGCGEQFESWPSQKRQFCSLQCKGRSQASIRQTPMPTKPRRGAEVPCLTCGKLVYGSKAQHEAGQAKYCSKACANVGQSRNRVIKTCVVCGKEIQLSASQAPRIQTCSMECQATRRTKRPMERMHNGKPARKDKAGYVMVYEPDHPNKSLKGWQYEHRLVVEKALGRYLRSDEHVHHVNGTKDDNRLENLEVMDANDHARLSSQDFRDSINRQLAELAEYKRRYGPLEEV